MKLGAAILSLLTLASCARAGDQLSAWWVRMAKPAAEAPATWSPSNIVGAYCWLNFSDTNMMTGASTSVYKIVDWLDPSRSATNTVARSPSITNINGVTALYFNQAQSDFLKYQYTNSPANSWMVFLACYPNDKTNHQTLFVLNNSPLFKCQNVSYAAAAGPDGTIRRINIRAGSGTFYATNAAPPVVPAVIAIATWTNAYRIQLNNTVIGEGTNITGGQMAAVGVNSYYVLGCTTDSSENFRGIIGEYGMVPTYDESTWTNAIAYLIEKWGVTP